MSVFADNSKCRRSAIFYIVTDRRHAILRMMKTKTVRDIAVLAHQRRGELGWSQSQLAKAVGVGREWIIDFEKGKPTVEWGLVLRTLKELNLEIDLSPSTHSQPPLDGTDLSSILNRTLRKT